jgi:hypothetical protein
VGWTSSVAPALISAPRRQLARLSPIRRHALILHMPDLNDSTAPSPENAPTSEPAASAAPEAPPPSPDVTLTEKEIQEILATRDPAVLALLGLC